MADMYMPASAVPRNNQDSMNFNDSLDQEYMPSSAVLRESPSSVKDVLEGERPASFPAQIGTLGRGLAYGAADILNPFMESADYINQKLAGLFGKQMPHPYTIDPTVIPIYGASAGKVQNLDAAAQLGGALGSFVGAEGPRILDTGVSALQSVGSLAGKAPIIKTLLGKNVETAQQAFNTKAQDTLEKILGNDLNSPREQLNQNVDQALQQMYNTPNYKGLIGNENEALSQIVSDMHANNKGIGSKRFNTILDNQNPTIENQWLNKIKAPSTEAPGNPQLQQWLDQIQGKPPLLDKESVEINKLKNINPLLSQNILNTKANPTLRNLHDLQSQMGNLIADAKSVPYAEQNRAEINLLTKYRDKTIDDISSVVPEYQDAKDYWFKNVIPFYENPAINKLVRKDIPPANIANILSKPELPGARIAPVRTILNQLTPEQKQLIPLSKLSGTAGNPLIDLNGNINVDNFAKNSQGLTAKNIQQFLTPDIRNKLASLGPQLKQANLQDAMLKGVQDISGNLDSNQLVKNLQNLDPELMNSNQKQFLQNSFSNLKNLSEKVSKEQDRTDDLKKLLKLSGGIAGTVGTGSALYHLFRNGGRPSFDHSGE